MITKVRRTLVARKLIDKGDRVIVALSGGADSVSLLQVLLMLRDEFDLTVMAAHVNHNLRGEESLRDEAFVSDLCKAEGVELFVCSADVNALAVEQKQSVELCARQVRYEFFEELSKIHNAKIATAHTLSDSEETMLYNISRGTTLHGLCSIPYKRDYIIRPLLDVSREDVENFCRENSVEFVQDSTNFCEDVCKRNKIRLSVLPPLRCLNDGFHRNFLNLREDLLCVDDFLRKSAEEALRESECRFGFDANKLLSYHPAVVNYALNLIVSQAGAKAENCHIKLCSELLSKGGAVALIGNFTAVCTQGIFRVVSDLNSEEFCEIPFKAGTSFVYNNTQYSIKEITNYNNINKKLASFCIGYDKINDDTVIRTRREGDIFAPQGRGLTKPLRKLQNELKIPCEKRDVNLVVATGNTVLWAEDIGASAHGAINKDTLCGLCICIKRGEQNA